MADNGEEKLMAMARQIAKSLGHNDSMADDILQIFSTFDGRFSRDKLSDKFGHDSSAHLEHTLTSFHRQIAPYLAADHAIWSDSTDSSAFLDCVDELIAAVRGWTSVATSDKTVGACLLRADELMQQVVFRLEEEFRLLMERGGESFDLTTTRRSAGNLSFDSEDDDDDDGVFGGRENGGEIPVAHPLTDYDVVIDALPSGTINDLHEIAKRMVAAGYRKECSHVYSTCRREFLEESMSRLGLQKLSIEEVQKMMWQDLEDEMEKWIKAANVALRILFPSERRLCDRVFFGLSSAADLSFMEVCRGPTIQLLNFADAVAIGSRSPDRLFKILDLFETMRDLMPEFEANFSDRYCLVLMNDAMAIWKRLGEAIRGIFMELENLIRRDPAKAPVPRGGLHPMTRYVMNYLRAACRSRESLEQVFQENIGIGNVGGVASSKDSTLSVRMEWIMETLESNLEVKSRIYGDPALCAVFLMNNGKYIVQKVKDSELGSLLGDDWIRKHMVKIKQFHTSYRRSSWNKILQVLETENISGASAAIATNVGGKTTSMKEKIKLFNSLFEDICKTQSHWIVFDEQLRKELRVSLTNLLVPAYGSFLGKFKNALEVGKHTDRYIKYSVEDIEVRINELFQGGSGMDGGRR